MTQRTHVQSLRGREGNQVSARPGEEYVINRAMHLCNPPLSWREIAQEMAWLSSRSKTCLITSTTSLHKDFVTLVLSFQ